MLPLALRYLGRDPVHPGPADYAAAEVMLMKVRPSIAVFVNSSDAHELIDGELCVTIGYSGAITLGAEKARRLDAARDIVHDLPRVGTLMWFDSMAIPKTARHPDNAHRFIDYILRPDVVAKISNARRYANANRDALPYMDPALARNPLIYPGETVRRTLFTPEAEAPALSRLQGRGCGRA
ncbi:extracellular solute-binding protein [Burkholderia sp. FERM BP-3421]|uniref:extracellular solute-binding protein n=1 Tax=Burkholderia sp. FERM BP-3421 TaxID=1494466 RepID=UPI00236107D2|nr:extracellular solute-binding protein [Burkholderia sp. FERM BP-3421]